MADRNRPNQTMRNIDDEFYSNEFIFKLPVSPPHHKPNDVSGNQVRKEAENAPYGNAPSRNNSYENSAYGNASYEDNAHENIAYGNGPYEDNAYENRSDQEGTYEDYGELYEDEGYEDSVENPYDEELYDEDLHDGETYDEESDEEPRYTSRKRTNARPKKSSDRPWWKYVLNFHVLFAAIVIFIIVTVILVLKDWGVKVDPNYIDQLDSNVDGRDTFDVIMPLLDEEGNVLANKSPHTILFFGNSPFADDRDSENNVVNMISKRIGAKVYNLSVKDSLLAAQSESIFLTDSGLDVYNFYWMCIYLTWDEHLGYFDWLESDPNVNYLPETQEIRNTMDTIDMNTVDTICIMYDGSDYLEGSIYFNEQNETDIQSFSGNLLAGIEVLQAKYPHIRIIVMSPTYAFGIDDNGEYVSSDIKVYGEGATLSSYMIKECETVGSRGISFIDNIYGTFNEDEASEYLTDNLHLNQNGREKLVRRICSFITHYDEK